MFGAERKNPVTTKTNTQFMMAETGEIGIITTEKY